jgi:hypothetical protein
MEMKSPITGTMTFKPSQIALSLTSGRLARQQVIAHIQGEKPHILIRNRESTMEN